MTAPPTTTRDWTQTWIAPAIVAAVAAIVLLPAMRGAFVADDRASVVENPLLSGHAPWTSVLSGAFGPDPFGYTRPLRTIEFAADVALFGVGPLAFHVHSALWHVAASVLALFVMRRLLGSGPAALLAALVFAAHPAQVEAVAWISARGDVAMGACVLLSILFALRFDGRGVDLAVSLAAAAAAMLYKEAALFLPIVVAALRRTGLCRAPLWPYALVSGAYLAWRLVLSHAPPASDVGFVLGGSTEGTFATMSRAFGFYVVETLAPAQSFDWYMSPSRSFDEAAAVVWLVVHAALVGSAIATRRRAPLWTASVVWFYAFLLAVANWPFSVGKPTSERYLYLSTAGFALAVGWAVLRAPRAAWAAALVAVGALGVQAFSRSATWTNDDVLYGAVLEDHDSPGARYYFAGKDFAAGIDEMVRARSAAAGPARDAAARRSDELLERSLRSERAAIAVWRAYDASPRSRSKILRRFEVVAARIAYFLRRHDEALAHADEALRIDPTFDGHAEHERALPLLALGFAPEAAASMKRALALGLPKADAEVADFFLRAGAKCEEDDLRATAEDCYASSIESAADPAARRAAEERLFALRRRPWSADAQAAEGARIQRLDEELARRPRPRLDEEAPTPPR